MGRSSSDVFDDISEHAKWASTYSGKADFYSALYQLDKIVKLANEAKRLLDQEIVYKRTLENKHTQAEREIPDEESRFSQNPWWGD